MLHIQLQPQRLEVADVNINSSHLLHPADLEVSLRHAPAFRKDSPEPYQRQIYSGDQNRPPVAHPL